MEWKLYPHSPDQITFTCIKAKYDPQAKCQIFEEYLQRVTGGDFLLSKRVWMAIGYLLIYPARGKFFIFIHDIGKGYEKSTDDRGHAIADRFDGANDLENLVPQDAGLNRNEFKNFESKLAQELEAGKQVYLKLEMHYPGDSFRPDAITAETTIDGRQEVKVFLNDKY